MYFTVLHYPQKINDPLYKSAQMKVCPSNSPQYVQAAHEAWAEETSNIDGPMVKNVLQNDNFKSTRNEYDDN
jgi:hypothetical protein